MGWLSVCTFSMEWGSEGHDDYTHPNCYFQVDSIFFSHVFCVVSYPAEGHVGHENKKVTLVGLGSNSP